MSKKSLRKNRIIYTGQYLAGLMILFWFISWYIGLIDNLNYGFYVTLLVVILASSILFIFKTRKILKIVWAITAILIALLLMVIYRFSSNGFGV